MLKHLAAVAALALAIGTAACGDDEGGEDGGSGDDFVTQLNTICEESTEEVIAVNLELGYATDPKDQAELSQQILDIRAESTEEIEALEVPEGDAEAFDMFLAAREDLITTGEDRLAAVKSGDEAALQKAIAAGEKAGDEEDEAAEALGADLCDGVIPEGEAQAAEDTLREFATTADPATSCEYENEDALVTEAFVEGGFGGIEPCSKEQEALEKNPDDLAKDIKVSSSEGVEEHAVTLTYEDVGGIFGGEPTEATLYYLDGGWKIYGIRPLEQ